MKTKLSFQKRVHRRIWVWSCVLIGLLILMVLVGEFGKIDSRYTTKLADMAMRILFFGFLGYAVYQIYYNRSLLRNRQKLREEQLRERDERTQWIYDKSGGIPMDLLLLGLTIAACYWAFTDVSAFNTAVSLLLLAACVKLTATLYYHRQ